MNYVTYSDRPDPGDAFNLIRVDSRTNSVPGYHAHRFAEIFWIVEGRCRHVLNERESTLEPGAICFLRPLIDRHCFLGAPRHHFVFTNFTFTTAHLQDLLQRHRVELGRFFARKPAPPLQLRVSPGVLAEMNDRALALADRPNTRLYAEHFLFDLVALLTPHAPATPLGDDVPPWLREACIRIREPDVFQAGVRGFIRAAGRSHEHVTRTARRMLGRAPSQLVNDARMAYARKQLLMTTKSVTEVSLECGFNNTTQFHALFRSYFGTTPKRYQRAQRELGTPAS